MQRSRLASGGSPVEGGQRAGDAGGAQSPACLRGGQGPLLQPQGLGHRPLGLSRCPSPCSCCSGAEDRGVASVGRGPLTQTRGEVLWPEGPPLLGSHCPIVDDGLSHPLPYTLISRVNT